MSINERLAISPRKIALTAGVLYLLTFVSIPTLALYSSIHNPNYIVGSGPDTPVLIGVILEIIVALVRHWYCSRIVSDSQEAERSARIRSRWLPNP